jgi:hypothetical protein
MSRGSYTAFQRHLLFFSTPTQPPRLTFLSGLRAGVSIGLDFPVAVILSLSLRLMYAPFPFISSTINIEEIPRPLHRAQLNGAKLSKQEYTCSELLALLGSPEPGKGFIKHKIDQGHIVGFWTMASRLAGMTSSDSSRANGKKRSRGDVEDETMCCLCGEEDQSFPQGIVGLSASC